MTEAQTQVVFSALLADILERHSQLNIEQIQTIQVFCIENLKTVFSKQILADLLYVFKEHPLSFDQQLLMLKNLNERPQVVYCSRRSRLKSIELITTELEMDPVSMFFYSFEMIHMLCECFTNESDAEVLFLLIERLGKLRKINYLASLYITTIEQFVGQISKFDPELKKVMQLETWFNSLKENKPQLLSFFEIKDLNSIVLGSLVEDGIAQLETLYFSFFYSYFPLSFTPTPEQRVTKHQLQYALIDALVTPASHAELFELIKERISEIGEEDRFNCFHALALGMYVHANNASIILNLPHSNEELELFFVNVFEHIALKQQLVEWFWNQLKSLQLVSHHLQTKCSDLLNICTRTRLIFSKPVVIPADDEELFTIQQQLLLPSYAYLTDFWNHLTQIFMFEYSNKSNQELILLVTNCLKLIMQYPDQEKQNEFSELLKTQIIRGFQFDSEIPALKEATLMLCSIGFVCDTFSQFFINEVFPLLVNCISQPLSNETFIFVKVIQVIVEAQKDSQCFVECIQYYFKNLKNLEKLLIGYQNIIEKVSLEGLKTILLLVLNCNEFSHIAMQIIKEISHTSKWFERYHQLKSQKIEQSTKQLLYDYVFNNTQDSFTMLQVDLQANKFFGEETQLSQGTHSNHLYLENVKCLSRASTGDYFAKLVLMLENQITVSDKMQINIIAQKALFLVKNLDIQDLKYETQIELLALQIITSELDLFLQYEFLKCDVNILLMVLQKAQFQCNKIQFDFIKLKRCQINVSIFAKSIQFLSSHKELINLITFFSDIGVLSSCIINLQFDVIKLLDLREFQEFEKVDLKQPVVLKALKILADLKMLDDLQSLIPLIMDILTTVEEEVLLSILDLLFVLRDTASEQQQKQVIFRLAALLDHGQRSVRNRVRKVVIQWTKN